MKTHVTKAQDMERKWYLIDADGMVLGRLATRVAGLLMGKGKAVFSPAVDTGDFVVVINAGKIRLTGRKASQKFLFTHSGYPSGAKFTRYDKLLGEKPETVIMTAVKGMLPHNKVSARLITKLKVYRGKEHPHTAQKPQALAI